MRSIVCFFAIAIMLAVATEVAAQQAGAVQVQQDQASRGIQADGGVAIGGDLRANIDVDSSYVGASGSGAEATADIGSIKDGTAIGGDVSMNTRVGQQTTSASGTGARARTSIGSIGGN